MERHIVTALNQSYWDARTPITAPSHLPRNQLNPTNFRKCGFAHSGGFQARVPSMLANEHLDMQVDQFSTRSYFSTTTIGELDKANQQSWRQSWLACRVKRYQMVPFQFQPWVCTRVWNCIIGYYDLLKPNRSYCRFSTFSRIVNVNLETCVGGSEAPNRVELEYDGSRSNWMLSFFTLSRAQSVVFVEDFRRCSGDLDEVAGVISSWILNPTICPTREQTSEESRRMLRFSLPPAFNLPTFILGNWNYPSVGYPLVLVWLTLSESRPRCWYNWYNAIHIWTINQGLGSLLRTKWKVVSDP